MKKLTLCTLLPGTLLQTSCATYQPILNIKQEPVTQTLSQKQVEKAILMGGLQKGWTMKVTQPGLIRGTITVRTHQATIDVPYTDKDFSIQYVSSVGLNDNGKGTIHRNYNKWITLLDQAIRIELTGAVTIP